MLFIEGKYTKMLAGVSGSLTIFACSFPARIIIMRGREPIPFNHLNFLQTIHCQNLSSGIKSRSHSGRKVQVMRAAVLPKRPFIKSPVKLEFLGSFFRSPISSTGTISLHSSSFGSTFVEGAERKAFEKLVAR